ncbi:type VII toxin-antitoxin system MntA family adenylyltransferase antitoxin [Pantanalinema rosaneae CENA516]|uniref:type VII toxin-antitoxin system MntA family adenylyltransferase antitoxin n=1 Tax=Pantanalinema rosaneae TaxID=1620701 RepID=UPI003D701DBC
MHQDVGTTNLEQLISLLSDGKWHSSRELAEKVSWRFGHAVYEARKQGYQVEKHQTNNCSEYRILNPQAPAEGAQLASLKDLKAVAPFVIEQVPYLKLLILFGSRAKETYNDESDWDFAVLYDEALRTEHEKGGWDWLRIWNVLEEVFDLPEGKVDCVILNDCSNILAHSIARDGKLLYEKDPGAFEQFKQQALMSKAELKAFRAEQREKVREGLARLVKQ